MATTGTYYHAAHWHHLTRQPLAPFNTSTTGTNMFFQLKVRLNIHISLTGMSHQMVFIFCARIFARIFARILSLYFETICFSN